MTLPERLRALARGLGLRCPRCGVGATHRHLLRALPACEHCGLSFTLEEGEFTGGVYLCYGVAALIFIPGFLVTELVLEWDIAPQLVLWIGFAIAFPLGFQRHATGAFMALLYATGALQDTPQAMEREALSRRKPPAP